MSSASVGGARREYLVLEYASAVVAGRKILTSFPMDPLDQPSRYVGGQAALVGWAAATGPTPRPGAPRGAREIGRAGLAVRQTAVQASGMFAGHAVAGRAGVTRGLATGDRDQLTAIEEVKAEPIPMDRAMRRCRHARPRSRCGGRSAAVQDGKQVAVLVLTPLADQHLQTFRERMSDSR